MCESCLKNTRIGPQVFDKFFGIFLDNILDLRKYIRLQRSNRTAQKQETRGPRQNDTIRDSDCQNVQNVLKHGIDMCY